MSSHEDKNAEKIEQLMQGMRSDRFAPRTGYGTKGRPIKVHANAYELQYGGLIAKPIIHYDITMEPVVRASGQKKPKGLLQRIFITLEEQETRPGGPFASAFAAMAFDGEKNAFTVVALGKKAHEFIVDLPELDGPPPPAPLASKPAPPGAKPKPTGKMAAKGGDAGGPGKDDADCAERRKWKVSLTEVQRINASVLQEYSKGSAQAAQVQGIAFTTIMALNVLLRAGPSRKYTPVGGGGNRFFGGEGRVDLPGGAVVGKGFFQSVRPGNQSTPYLNLDTAYTAFVKEGPLLEVAARVLGLGGSGSVGGRGGRGGPRGGGRGGRGGFVGGHGTLTSLNANQTINLKRLLKGARFTLTYRSPGKEFRLESISTQSAQQIRFGDDTGAKVSLVDYFATRYNIHLQFPGMPCVVFKGGKAIVPFELVRIAANHSIPPTRLTADQTADMIKVTALPPPERKLNTDGWRRTLGYERAPKLAAWGVGVSSEMKLVDARVLDPPTVVYRGSQSIKPGSGAWNLVGKKFRQPAPVPLWAWSVISFDAYMRDDEIQNFIGTLVKILTASGISVENARPPITARWDPRDPSNVQLGMRNTARAAHQAGAGKMDPQLIICILPSKDARLYEEIKRWAMMFGPKPVATQCLLKTKISGERAERGSPQYCSNVAMKIMAKLGGVTHALSPSDTPGVDKESIIFGADVTHSPVRGDADSIPPSIAAVVATTNGTQTQYRAQVRLQTGRVEIIQDLRAMTASLLRAYRKSNSDRKAQRVIFYRDGVSEGQFDEVVDKEVAAIKAAFREVDPKGPPPKLTYIICGKRHHIRFYAKAPTDKDRTGNLPAGTVIDRGVTSAIMSDFYLQAHAGLVGTARPTHYSVLVDENAFTADRLQ